MAQDIPRMSQILSSSSPKYTKLSHADAAIELKEKANALFRNKLFSDALSLSVRVHLSTIRLFNSCSIYEGHMVQSRSMLRRAR